MSAVTTALFRCGVFGACCGAACSVIFAGLSAVAAGIGQRSVLYALVVFPISIPYSLMFGLPAGFIAGVVGGMLGGPLGWSVGGIVGPAVSLCLLLQHVTVAQALQLALFPSLTGAGVGLVIGWDLRRREPTLFGGGPVAEVVYHSPLGRWLGWRKRDPVGA